MSFSVAHFPAAQYSRSLELPSSNRVEYAVHWIVADIGTFIFAMGLMCVGFALNAYTIDVYPLYAASALAVTNSVRSIFG